MLPEDMKLPELKPYYRRLYKKRGSLLVKRGFDIAASLFLLVPAIPVMAGVAVWIKLDSEGPVFFRQERMTQYGKRFRICKFRTMEVQTDGSGPRVTAGKDPRITGVGKKIRSIRLDEVPQLINILKGDMTFVGTRPEVPHYVDRYKNVWKATLLLPAGVTSEASIEYRNEDERLKVLMDKGLSVDEAYIKHILPEKMAVNLREIKDFTLLHDFGILLKTLFAVIKR